MTDQTRKADHPAQDAGADLQKNAAMGEAEGHRDEDLAKADEPTAAENLAAALYASVDSILKHAPEAEREALLQKSFDEFTDALEGQFEEVFELGKSESVDDLSKHADPDGELAKMASDEELKKGFSHISSFASILSQIEGFLRWNVSDQVHSSLSTPQAMVGAGSNCLSMPAVQAVQEYLAMGASVLQMMTEEATAGLLPQREMMDEGDPEGVDGTQTDDGQGNPVNAGGSAQDPGAMPEQSANAAEDEERNRPQYKAEAIGDLIKAHAAAIQEIIDSRNLGGALAKAEGDGDPSPVEAIVELAKGIVEASADLVDMAEVIESGEEIDEDEDLEVLDAIEKMAVAIVGHVRTVMNMVDAMGDDEGEDEGEDEMDEEGDAEKADLDRGLSKSAPQEDALAKMNADLLDRLEKMSSALDGLRSEVSVLKNEPAPAKGALMAVEKSADTALRTSEPDLEKIAADIDAMPEDQKSLALIKFAHKAPRPVI